MMMLSSALTGIATTLIVTFVQSLYRSLSQSRVAHTGIIATTLTTFVQFLYRSLRQDTVVHIPRSHTHSLSLTHTHRRRHCYDAGDFCPVYAAPTSLDYWAVLFMTVPGSSETDWVHAALFASLRYDPRAGLWHWPQNAFP